MTQPNVPRDGAAFEALMREIDAKLAADGVGIPARPIMAIREVGLRFKLTLPIAGDVNRMSPELRANAPLTAAIKKWFDDAYGERLNVDPCPGRTVVRLDGDLYTLRVPQLYGTIQFVMSQKFLPEPRLGRGPSYCNMVQLVDDLTEAKALRLTYAALEEINGATLRAIHAIYTLDSTPHELMRIAKGDVAVAISNLMARPGRFGESKWASLQAAEKMLKAAIALAGGSFGKVHELEKLFGQLAALGICVDPKPYIDAIQCKPGIRYGEETCTLEEALDAHRRSLDLVNALRDAGAKFNLGLGGVQ